jgi:hypothetical protein
MDRRCGIPIQSLGIPNIAGTGHDRTEADRAEILALDCATTAGPIGPARPGGPRGRSGGSAGNRSRVRERCGPAAGRAAVAPIARARQEDNAMSDSW